MIWLFFCAIQILLLINQKVKILLPDSVNSFTKAVSGIVSLDAINKQQLMGYFKVPSAVMKPNSLLDNLGLIGLAIGLIAVFVLVIVVARLLVKSPRVQAVIQRAHNTIFWNGLVKYNQGAFLNFCYAGIVSFQFATSLSTKLVPGGILILEGLIILYQTVYLVSHDP